MFSTRAGFDLAANAFAAEVEVRRAHGRRFDDLTDANPTRAGLVEPARALAAALRELAHDPRALVYAPDAQGDLRAREAIAAFYRRRGAPLEPSQLVLTAGTSEAYAHLFRLLGDPRDEVLVPRPSYPLFDLLASLEGLEAVGYATRRAAGVHESALPAWSMDLGALARQRRARAILAVHPHNPTGAYVAPHERRALRAWACERGAALIVDEVFLDFPVAAGIAEPSFLVDDPGDDGPLCFVLSGVSKALALPQLKLAWIAVGGPSRLRDEALARLAVIADTFLSVSTPSQHVLPSLLDAAPAVVAEIRARLRTNHAALAAWASAESGIEAVPVAGGWTAMIRVTPPGRRPLDEDALVSSLLAEDDVLVQPGWLFDLDPAEHAGAAHLVLSLLPEPARFAAAAQRLVAGCARWRRTGA